ncbi:3'(2'),5'-bisphosphate nucleotidase CysQ [Polymorphum gilvum]|uniref:3'(2'),5'-bisphosphate nucleotidase CysQ n=1 Tax=Polymorphum gilvum (strain LMG 25793 / CGMCC 1.9160 / SL003B-26A1) TaxID=991905 RepID=F2IW85_POLGS|nr:3'(2'),5'-bisphosphate nucleotidase CysQ [Polymorphum gilvum]ADZ71470.1 3'(2'),5'-bisphosphate nucleotidase [Polymorphum gilvum SL003B-26A1]
MSILSLNQLREGASPLAMTEALIALALEAGTAILAVYETAGAARSEAKADGSPVTEADEAAEKVILAGLAALAPEVPVVAEEAVAAGDIPPVSGPYFLVDPLDGTREFIKRNGEFTVNIALVEDGVPVLGVVLAPALGEIYWGDATGAWSGRVAGAAVVERRPIAVRRRPEGGLGVLASRSHLSEETSALIDRLPVAELLSVGSSLKLCWVAAGRADVYPRLSPTMQWDIAAGHAVLRAAGGRALAAGTREELAYRLPPVPGRDDLVNRHFIAIGDQDLIDLVA